MILIMCGYHSITYPVPINVFNTLKVECEIEWITCHCVCAVFEHIVY